MSPLAPLALAALASAPLAQIAYVDASSTGAQTGTSWGDAFRHLQNALAVATAGGERGPR